MDRYIVLGITIAARKNITVLYLEWSCIIMMALNFQASKHKKMLMERTKTCTVLTSNDLGHQNPEINSREELIADFERIYKRRILPEDTVTVIYFTEVHEDM